MFRTQRHRHFGIPIHPRKATHVRTQFKLEVATEHRQHNTHLSERQSLPNAIPGALTACQGTAAIRQSGWYVDSLGAQFQNALQGLSHP